MSQPNIRRLHRLNQRGFDHVLVAVAFVVLVGVIGTAMVVSSHAASLTWSGELQNGYDRSLCMNDSNSSRTSKTPISIYACGSAVSEKWTIAKNSDSEFLLKNGQGICADDKGDGVGTTPLQTYTCNGADHAQLWKWNGHELENVYSKGCINDPGSSKTNGTQLHVASCSDPGSEQWFEAAQSSSSGGSGSTSTSGGCKSGSTVAPCIGSATTGASGWGAPKFDDEFNGTSLNTTYWNSSWFNGGTMNNVSTSASNVSESGGSLNLTLSSSGTGALVSTNPKGGTASTGFTFGTNAYVEARIYFPGNSSGIYNWPAFWTDGQSWPTTGESDIAEILGGNMTSNYHSPQGANNGPSEGTSWANGWHTYALDRENGTDVIYYDGKEVRSYSSDDGGAAQYIIFNVGCSGSCTTGSASTVKVDYVRVWEK